MDFRADFATDAEFLKLLERREEVDLTSAALELARDACPELEFAPVFSWIDERAAELSGPLARAASDATVLGELGRCIAGRHGITGTAEIYEQADGSFLNRVIERKTGIPISLSVLYMAVAARAGLGLTGVAAPRHFLTRYETPDSALFVDAFAGGAVLSFEQCLGRVLEAAECSAQAARAALEPVGPRKIIIRMLNNLKALYARHENWPACWKVQHRLLALAPASYHERRDWAIVSLKSGRAGAALDMLESCLVTCPSDERELLQQQAAEAKRQTARWN